MLHVAHHFHILALGLLTWSAQAAVPKELEARAATCNRDNCYREVFATTIAGRSSQGAKDCTSYLQSTVTPCAVTVTITATASTLAGVQVVPIFVTTTATVTPTSYTTVTSTVTTVSTTSVLGAVNNAKRDALAPRATTCPFTNTPSAQTVPKYASDCTGTRFSSVCSCNGNIPTAAVTISASTTTATLTVTVGYTTQSTSTATSTTTQFAMATTSTSTTTITVTSTSTVKYMQSAIACPSVEQPYDFSDPDADNYRSPYFATTTTCICYARSGQGFGGGGLCSNGYYPSQPCASNTDCPNGEYCLSYRDDESTSGFINFCSDTASCMLS